MESNIVSLDEHRKKKVAPKTVFQILFDAVAGIAEACPILAADKDGMYNERASNLFLRSTVRRMEIAMKAVKEVRDIQNETEGRDK